MRWSKDIGLVRIVRMRYKPRSAYDYKCNLRGAKIKLGIRVKIVLKQHQRSGILTEGIVKDILTNSSAHPHGIKVRLTGGKVGRVARAMYAV